jgi:hypothetical protein
LLAKITIIFGDANRFDEITGVFWIVSGSCPSLRGEAEAIQRRKHGLPRRYRGSQ